MIVLLARKIRQKYADDQKKLDRLAIMPLLAAAILVAYATLKP